MILIFFAISNSMPKTPYESVISKWFKYGKVVPPLDFTNSTVREIEIDFIAPKESSENGDFYWLQSSGDLITLTNRNFTKISGILSLNLETDPCRTPRQIIIGNQGGGVEYATKQNKPSLVKINFEIESNSSIFLSIVGLPNTICTIPGSDKRQFMAKVTNVKITNIIKK